MKIFREFKDEAEYQHVPLEERKFTLQQRLKADSGLEDGLSC